MHHRCNLAVFVDMEDFVMYADNEETTTLNSDSSQMDYLLLLLQMRWNMCSQSLIMPF